MATINGLTTLAVADVTASDFLPIYDASAGTDKKTALFSSGSWTPVLTFGGASTGITYGTQTGSWVRIGTVVHVKFGIILTSKGSATGAAAVTGLPVAASGTYDGMHSRFYSAFTGLAGDPFAYIGSTTVNLVQFSATAAATITDANFTNTTRLDMYGFYIA